MEDTISLFDQPATPAPIDEVRLQCRAFLGQDAAMPRAEQIPHL
jgi:hypothetical protein